MSIAKTRVSMEGSGIVLRGLPDGPRTTSVAIVELEKLNFFLLEVGLAEELEEELAEGLEEELVVATLGSALRGGLGGVLHLRSDRRQDGGVVRRCRPAASSTCG